MVNPLVAGECGERAFCPRSGIEFLGIQAHPSGQDDVSRETRQNVMIIALIKANHAVL
jgi:hypothetical protein